MRQQIEDKNQMQWVFLTLLQSAILYWPLWLALILVQILILVVGADPPVFWLPLILFLIGFVIAAIYPL